MWFWSWGRTAVTTEWNNMPEKPSYIGLLNAISVAESEAECYLNAWAAVTPNDDVRSVLDHSDLRGALRSPGGRRDLSALGVLVFDQARNELIQALAKGLGEPPRTLFAVRGVAHMTRAEAQRLARRLHAVLKTERARRKRARAAGARRSRQRYALTVAMVPLTKVT